MLYLNNPKIDLHGEQTVFVYSLLSEFINDNCKLKNKTVSIIHGKSTNILTKEVHKVLSSNKKVLKYHLNNWNLGETIVHLKED